MKIETTQVISRIEFENRLEFRLGDNSNKGFGILIDINKKEKGFELVYSEGYSLYLDLEGNKVDEDDI